MVAFGREFESQLGRISACEEKNPPRSARRKAWSSRTWARIRRFFPRPGEVGLVFFYRGFQLPSGIKQHKLRLWDCSCDIDMQRRSGL